MPDEIHYWNPTPEELDRVIEEQMERWSGVLEALAAYDRREG